MYMTNQHMDTEHSDVVLVFVEERPMIRYLRKRDLLAGSSAVP